MQSNQSLRSWEKQIQAGRPVKVLHGTKGGRSRDVSLLDLASKGRALSAVREAIRVADKQDGKLIPSTSLEGANRAYQRAMNEVGFKGSEASHSLRYQFAREQVPEFVLYWLESKQPHASWNTKFITHVKYRWARRHDQAWQGETDGFVATHTDNSWATGL